MSVFFVIFVEFHSYLYYMKKKYITLVTNSIIGIMLLTLSILTVQYSVSYVGMNEPNEAIYYGNQNTSNISLMINVYWGTEYLDSILNILEQYEVKCTFFVGGQWVEKNPDYLEKIYDNGHEIGNHGYFHKDHDKLTYSQNYDEIYVNHQLVKQTIGIDMNLFAPPSGAYNKTTLSVADSLGYKTIMWSKDTIDWRDHDSNLIFDRATKNIKGGDLILMHPTEMTVKALPNILQYYQKHNLIATTVSNTVKS